MRMCRGFDSFIGIYIVYLFFGLVVMMDELSGVFGHAVGNRPTSFVGLSINRLETSHAEVYSIEFDNFRHSRSSCLITKWFCLVDKL